MTRPAGRDVGQPMREFPLERTRNIGIVAHIDAGKTTLTERLLYFAGAIHECGEVHDGTTTTDFGDLEREKGITISAAAIPCAWTPHSTAGLDTSFSGQTHRLNLIDTPGHVDFTAEVERSLRVLDGLVAVFCGVAGVQPQSETVWRQADRYHVPRLAFVNKMDRMGADFARTVRDLRRKLGANAWPISLPWGAESPLCGQFDVVHERALRFGSGRDPGYAIVELPPAAQASVRRARLELVEALAELDETVADVFLANERVPAPLLLAAIRRQTIAGRFVPVLGGSAYKFIGVQPLLDAVIGFLPSPQDLPSSKGPAAGTARTGSASSLADDAPLAAIVFKLAADRQAGKLVYVRVYSGTLRRGASILNPRTGRRERIGRLVRLHADKREDIAACFAGDIAAVLGLKNVATGDTLCDPEHPVLLAPPSFPEPVVSMAIEPQSHGELEKLASSLQRLVEEDPTFRTFTHPETGQAIIAGMGELHLDIMRQRLEREFGVRVAAAAPQIAYRETITTAAEANHLLKKQHGGAGMYARVALRVTPHPRGHGATIEDQVVGGSIPRHFIGACRNGIEDALKQGVLAGYPVIDVQVDIVDGATHEKDSNEAAFRLAATLATKEALRAANPILLEPVMRVECSVPAEHQGDILGDLTRRRARIVEVEAQQTAAIVAAHVPLSEMFGYANAIRSLSKGRAAHAMEPSHFEPVPDSLTGRILDDRRRR